MSTTADLPDLNVWLALAWVNHAHHRQALHYWEERAAGQVLFCTVTALGLVRLLSQPKPMGTSVKSGAEASAFLQGFCRQPGVTMAVPEHDEWKIFHGLLRKGDLAPRHYTDAYLAALAMANGWRLVSFDRDFQRFSDLHWLALT